MDFDTWLSQRLEELKTDEAVFGPYIKGIVEGDEELDEKIEILDGILAELGDPSLDVESLRKEILSRWDSHLADVAISKTQSSIQNGSGDFRSDLFAIPGNGAVSLPSAEKGDNQTQPGTSSLESQLEQLLRLSPESYANANNVAKDIGQSSADSALRAAILNQCQDQSDSEEEDGPEKGSSGGGGGLSGLSRNTNAERVLSEQKEYRENAKAESAKKREKDKEDRAKQKKLAEERKDKAKKKSAKVERKR